MRALILAMLVPIVPAAAAESLRVDPTVGNSNFTAVFDAPLGERITALSSAVDCALLYEPSGLGVTGSCSVPLSSIHVDGDDVKAGHFRQWATNNKSDPAACKLVARIQSIHLAHALAPGRPTPFTAQAAFSVCGRDAKDGKQEPLEGTAWVFPAHTYGTTKTVKLRARIPAFSRERYLISPRYTDGWAARVQQLAPIVADSGEIELTLFAKVEK